MTQSRYRITKNLTLLAAAANLGLGVIKIVFGVLGRSHALVADGVHSLSDLLTDILVLLAAKYSTARADAKHPYGHGRIETAATLGLAALLSMAGFGIIWDAANHLFAATQAEVPKVYVLLIAFLSIVVNEAIYQVTIFYGKREQSDLLAANAWHHRSDAWSSLVVLIGVGCAILGFPRFDALAAIIVGLFIIKMAFQLGWSSVRELIDTSVDEETLAAIKSIIEQVTGVKTIHQLRTRLMANRILVDVHIIVEPYLSASEGHHIADTVQAALSKKIPSITDVTVHVDVENDDAFALTKRLPERKTLIAEINKRCQHCEGFKAILHYHLHYLAGQIELEIIMQLPSRITPEKKAQMTKAYEKALLPVKTIKSVVLLFK